MTDVVVEKKGHVAIVKIEHMKAMNALSTDMYAQLEEAFDEVGKMDDVYCVILTGSSTVNKKGKTVNSFVAGADIAQMSTMTVAEGKFFGNDSNRVCWKIENFKRPVIAAINGFALGGGNELAMACDIRIASSRSKFGQPEVGLGLIPGFTGTQRLSRLCGSGAAKQMIFTADKWSAEEALRVGLVDVVVPPEGLMRTARDLALKIMSKSMNAIKLAKKAINEGLRLEFRQGLLVENECWAKCFAADGDGHEGMTAFTEKRPANFDHPPRRA